jgi:hypothetical protein
VNLYTKIQQSIQNVQVKMGEASATTPAKSPAENRTENSGLNALKSLSKTISASVAHHIDRIATSRMAEGIRSVANNMFNPQSAEKVSNGKEDLFARELTRKMSEFFGKATEPKNSQELKSAVEKDLRKLYADFPTLDRGYKLKPGEKAPYPTAEVKEKLMLLKTLKNKIERDPAAIDAEMKQYGDTPIYKNLGGLQFLAIKAQIEKNIKDLGGENNLTKKERKLSVEERVAVFAYTTGKYSEVNPALRGAKGNPISDQGVAEMGNKVNSCLDNLPHFQVSQEVPVLKRAIKIPSNSDAFVEEIFGKETMRDFAFYSTSLDSKVSSDINVTILPPPGAKVFPHAHEVPSFLTAWGGEKEVLFRADTTFKVVSKEKNADGKSWNITIQCLPDKSVEPSEKAWIPGGFRSRIQSWRQSVINP